MASGDTKTESYLRVAAEGTRADLPSDTCCDTKTQSLIVGVAERIMDVEDEVEELKNNPDVVDIVDTYADLQNYDTQHLTDRDIIRVLNDETHSGDSTYYRYDKNTDTFTYIGESKQYTDFVGTDGTTAGTAGLVPAPATTDADKFLKSDGTWSVAGGGEFSKEITQADINYPADNPTSVALWLLDPGVYHVRKNAGFSVRVDASESFSGLDIDVVVFPKVINGNDAELTPLVYKTTGVDEWFFDYVYVTSGYSGLKNKFLMGKGVYNNLTTTTSGYVLDARQGKVLKDLIDNLDARVTALEG